MIWLGASNELLQQQLQMMKYTALSSNFLLNSVWSIFTMMLFLVGSLLKVEDWLYP